jgi:hypothetical protein
MSIKTSSSRKTLKNIPYYPKPKELLNELMKSKGWDYKTNSERYLLRDRSLACLLYVAELRISEALRLTKSQFQDEGNHILIKAIQLSKRKKGKVAYREARLPLKGERAEFTEFIMSYLLTLKSEARLFPWSLEEKKFKVGEYRIKDGTIKDRFSFQTVGTKRAWQIINALLPNYTQHWLRAFGEDYLYDAFDHDLLAVADEVKVDPRTLSDYLRKRHEKYKPA